MTTVTLRLESYDREARALVGGAQSLAEQRRNPEVEPLHLLHRLVERSAVAQDTVARAGVDPIDLLVECEALARRLPSPDGGATFLSTRLLELLGRAEGEASRARGALVSAGHLLTACAQESTGGAAAALQACGLSAPLLRAASSSAGAAPGADARKDDPLERYGQDLCALARQGAFDPVIGRDAELRRILQVLARRHENSPLLVGEAGIGKRAIVHALAGRLVRGDVPRTLAGKRLVALDLALLVAGTKLRSEEGERMRALLQAVRDAAGEVLLVVPDLGGLVSERAPSGAAQLLAAALGRGELRAIALATPEAARKTVDVEPALARRFISIAIEPPSPDETLAVLRGVVARYEHAHEVRITDPALVTAVRLARRYVPSAQLPKAAIDLIDEAAARVRVEVDGVPSSLDAMERQLEGLRAQHRSLEDDTDEASRRARDGLAAKIATLSTQAADARAAWTTRPDATPAGSVPRADGPGTAGDTASAGDATSASAAPTSKPRPDVLEADVADVVAAWTGVPVSRMLEAETQKLLAMEDKLRERVVGQDPAVAAVSRAVRRGRVGLRDPRRPIGSFLFLGPSGVGKTELAKALAEFLFDDELAMTRLDMSEFMEKHMVARLLGAPPGYADSEEGGFLTEAVRKRPYSVILFDEMEKAHPDVFNILLQVLDDGRLTDSRGRVAHFSDTVIIMTSNVGSQAILDHGEGVTREAIQGALEPQLRAHFRPEFLNRIDDVVIFDPLGKKELRGIVDIQLQGLGRLLAERQLSLHVTDAAKDRLTELGYEPAYGARPLKRVILKRLQDPLAEEILRGGYAPADAIEVDVDEGGEAFVFRRTAD